MSGLRKTTIVAIILFSACCVFGEKASAQFIAGSYGAGISPWWGTVPNAHGSGAGWTPSPEALYDERGRVTGSYNPVNGRTQGRGFMSPDAAHYGYRGREVVLYVPMDYGKGGVVVQPQNRYHRRHNRRW